MMIVIAATMALAFQLTQIPRSAADSDYVLDIFVKKLIAHPPLPEFQNFMHDYKLLFALVHGRTIG
jgi:hypothetical protein